MTKETKPEHFGRTLIYIPIIHTQADMGALSESVRRAAYQRMGLKGWKRKVSLIDNLWTEIEKTIENLDFPFDKVRLYQDGLPVCGREGEIVKELARTGSRNHQLLLRLMKKGAQIMGTESAELLVEEYELVKQILAAGGKPESSERKIRRKTLSDSLLKRRDQAIADRISSTLEPGETGILFLGIFHSLGNRLAKDIQVIYPTHKPLNREGK